MKKAIILLNMGGARTENELKEFIYNMFKDKRILNTPLRHIIAPIISNLRYKKVWQQYQLINGSRIYNLTEALVNKMQSLTDYEVIFSMRYTQPNLKDVIYDYDDVILLPLYPHYSTTTVESHIDEFKKLNFKGKARFIPPFYKHNRFNKILTQNILKSVKNPGEWNLIFSAHGLPQTIIKKGDVYQQQIEEHVDILSKELKDFQSISIAYQSRFGPIKWTKPYLDEHLLKFKGKKVLIYPLSFMIDNSETDFELHIEYAEFAKENGVVDYKVVTCPNDTDEVAEFLTLLSLQKIKEKLVYKF